ncbi:MAG: hypothetical protein U0804_09110 [Gemmataceae bacterium]
MLDTNPGHRPDAEWRRLLGGLVESLSDYTGIPFAVTSWFIEDHLGHAHAGGCVHVRGCVSEAFRLVACGVVCISVNHGAAAWASADVLLYSGGRRVFGPDGSEIVHFRYTPHGWSGRGWMNGECGEWEGYLTDARWHKTEPNSTV